MSMMEKQNTPRTRRSFTDEFKRDAVAMVLDDGRKIVDVAEALGVGEGTLGNWVRQERIDRGERAGSDPRRTRRAGRAAQGERPAADGTRSTQTSDGLLGEGVGTVTRYRWVAARKAEGFPITMACKVAEVSPPGVLRLAARSGLRARPTPRSPRPSWWRRCVRSTPSPTTPMVNRG